MLAAKPTVISPMLSQLLVVVTFHWNVEKLIYLETLLDTTRAYETTVDIVIVTDNGPAVENVLGSWGWAMNDSTLKVRCPTLDREDVSPHALLWAHRSVIEEELPRASYTSIIYTEDDTPLSWPTLISWALDTEVLEPLNFTRCIYRTEVDHKMGRTNTLDWMVPVQLTEGNLLHVANTSAWVKVSNRLQEGTLRRCGRLRNGSTWLCQVHQHYVSPGEPFQGIWMASRAQLERFMAHPYWHKESALNAPLPVPFRDPERSNAMLMFVQVPEGYLTNCMVPLVYRGDIGEGSRARLAPVAGVRHMRNGYTGVPGSWLGQMDVETALKDSV